MTFYQYINDIMGRLQNHFWYAIQLKLHEKYTCVKIRKKQLKEKNTVLQNAEMDYNSVFTHKYK